MVRFICKGNYIIVPNRPVSYCDNMSIWRIDTLCGTKTMANNVLSALILTNIMTKMSSIALEMQPHMHNEQSLDFSMSNGWRGEVGAIWGTTCLMKLPFRMLEANHIKCSRKILRTAHSNSDCVCHCIINIECTFTNKELITKIDFIRIRCIPISPETSIYRSTVRCL